MGLRWKIVYDPEMISGRKRKQAGLGALDECIPNRSATNETKPDNMLIPDGTTAVPDQREHAGDDVESSERSK